MPEGIKTHKVRTGETFGSIAKSFDMSMGELLALNPQFDIGSVDGRVKSRTAERTKVSSGRDQRDADMIFVGDALKVREGGKAPRAAAAPKSAALAPKTIAPEPKTAAPKSEPASARIAPDVQPLATRPVAPLKVDLQSANAKAANAAPDPTDPKAAPAPSTAKTIVVAGLNGGGADPKGVPLGGSLSVERDDGKYNHDVSSRIGLTVSDPGQVGKPDKTLDVSGHKAWRVFGKEREDSFQVGVYGRVKDYPLASGKDAQGNPTVMEPAASYAVAGVRGAAGPVSGYYGVGLGETSKGVRTDRYGLDFTATQGLKLGQVTVSNVNLGMSGTRASNSQTSLTTYSNTGYVELNNMKLASDPKLRATVRMETPFNKPFSTATFSGRVEREVFKTETTTTRLGVSGVVGPNAQGDTGLLGGSVYVKALF